MKIGVLKQLRRQRKMTQTELAAYLGMGQTTVAGWETGRAKPNGAVLAILAAYFGVTVDYLQGKTLEREEAPDIDETLRALEARLRMERPLKLGGKIMTEAAAKRLIDGIRIARAAACYEILTGEKGDGETGVSNGQLAAAKPGKGPAGS